MTASLNPTIASSSLSAFMKAMRLPAALFLLTSGTAFAASTITGTVTNGTNHSAAANDDVILIALSQQMKEVARTKTDSRGHYTIQSPDDSMHLVRVDHQKAAYFQPAPPNTPTVDVQVFDVAATVPGITTEANVLRAETVPKGLKVTQSYFIKNDSSPARTEFSDHSYEIYLPEGAQIQGAAAMGPGGMPVSSSPIPLGDPNHYAFVFPLRPGETQFQVSYQLPYSGSLKMTEKLATPADNLVVMLPRSMNFNADSSEGFQSVDPSQGGQTSTAATTYLIKNASPTRPVIFTLSGQGSLPRDVDAAAQGGGPQGGGAQGAEPNSPAAGSAAAQSDTRPGGGLGNPIDTPDPLNKYKWWILSGLGLAFAIAAGFLLRRPAAAAASQSVATSGPGNHQQNLINALKEELFGLETQRLQGTISELDYREAKEGLEVVMKRALTRQS